LVFTQSCNSSGDCIHEGLMKLASGKTRVCNQKSPPKTNFVKTTHSELRSAKGKPCTNYGTGLIIPGDNEF
jgi:hypothetical protein